MRYFKHFGNDRFKFCHFSYNYIAKYNLCVLKKELETEKGEKKNTILFC